MKVTDACSAQGDRPLYICDFSPPRSADRLVLEQAGSIGADFICVAYNPGRAVRVDSAMLAAAILRNTDKEVIFNLATRDMNKLALQSHLLGAQMLGLENLVVVQGDDFSEKDLSLLKPVNDFRPTTLMSALASMNQGEDFRGSRLRAATDFCIGASIVLGRGIDGEAALAHRKAQAGGQFFITQPVFSTSEVTAFREAYRAFAGSEISQPVFFGLQVLVKDGVIFSSVPEGVKRDLEQGRDGADIALELLHELLDLGVRLVYLVPPILRGGARDYRAAQRVLEGARKG